MNRFPRPYYDESEKPLCCFACDNKLTQNESDHYWNSHLMGEGEPYCFDCASEIEFDEPEDKPKRKPFPLVSMLLFGGSIGFLILMLIDGRDAGYFFMGAVACANVGLLARISKW